MVHGVTGPLFDRPFRISLAAVWWFMTAEGAVLRNDALQRTLLRFMTHLGALVMPILLLVAASGPVGNFVFGSTTVRSHFVQVIILFALLAHSLWGLVVLQPRDTGADVAIGAGFSSEDGRSDQSVQTKTF